MNQALMRTSRLLALAGSLLAASSAAVAAETAPATANSIDVSLACGQTSPLIGKTFSLATRSHGVSGTVHVIDDCTLSITNFNYDGKGLQVEVYSAVKGDFALGRPLSKDLLRPSKPYVDAEIHLRLPQALTVDAIEGISIWCSDVSVSFGDVLFSQL
ncbi:MAG: DM13 domain-containing protein [Pseudobdellovibrionaceae bacterium]|nr:DM13 domain-containing protein [Pseudobdellovibrionaceae bacterium]